MQTNTVVAAMGRVGLVWVLACLSATSGSAALVAHYTFDVNATSDSSGNGNHATAVNLAARTTGDKILGAAALDLSQNTQARAAGITGDHLAIPNLSGDFTNAATLSMWVKLDLATQPDVNPNLTGLAGLDGGANTHYPFIQASGPLAYFSTFRTPRVDNLTLLPGVDRTSWHQVTVTSDSTNGWRLYQNGQLVTSTTQGTFAIGNWTLGKSATSYWLDGLIDDAAIWNTGLSETKVSALYSLATTPGYGYDAGEANSLFAIFDSAGGSTVIDGTYWTYKTGLTTTIGQLQIVGGKPFLRLDAEGNGLSIPEPASLALFALAGLAAWRRRR